MVPGMVIGIIWERGEWWCDTRNGDRDNMGKGRMVVWIPGMVIGIIWERGERWCGTRNGDRDNMGKGRTVVWYQEW